MPNRRFALESTSAIAIITLHSLTQVSQVSLKFLSLNLGWILQIVVSIQQLPAFFRNLLVAIKVKQVQDS